MDTNLLIGHMSYCVNLIRRYKIGNTLPTSIFSCLQVKSTMILTTRLVVNPTMDNGDRNIE